MKRLSHKVQGVTFRLIGFLTAALFFVCSCSKDKEPVPDEKTVLTEYRIAIVLPRQGAAWKNTIEWSLQNLNDALAELRQINVTAEWFDENTENLDELFGTLANREDISAIIGPLYSRNASIAARQCYRTGKTLISPTVSSETVMRKYSQSPVKFLWCLTENDISQCEILLTRAQQKGAKKVSLLTSDDEYGTTFLDWFAFQAGELGLTAVSTERYSKEDVVSKMNKLLTEDSDCLICVPCDTEVAARMNECRNQRTNTRPFLLFSDVAYILPKDPTYEGMEGISEIYNPQSGFPVAYEVKFGEAPNYGSAHYFDAISLAGLAILKTDLTGGDTDINTSLRQIVDGTGDEINCSQEAGIRRAVKCLIDEKPFHITGASGNLYFDKDCYTNVIHSFYCHWQVYQAKHLILEYNVSDGSKRTDASAANWNWKVTQMQEFDNNIQRYYPPKEELYALIIAASSGWDNYRHQANAYALYRLLKKNGVDDDHILLISEDDVAGNPLNPTPGFIQSASGDENLYTGIRVDYHPSELSFQELETVIASGVSFQPGKNDNLFVYWAGEGEPESPKWLDDVIPAYEVAGFFERLSSGNHFRKLFFAMDACYGGQVGMACADKNIPGMLCLTATNDKETSKATGIDASGQVWLSDYFTDVFLKQVAKGEPVSMYDLYREVYNLTIGSHVSVYNADNYDNLYVSRIDEFLNP
ncbi:MAG: ABC transporter substrate-binding protein [Parabacteroides sp.]|nr:ABC transporter substrate-binding protein [Parabacteroides sp.]